MFSLFYSSIKWNFTKFLVDKSGQPVERFAPTVPPKVSLSSYTTKTFELTRKCKLNVNSYWSAKFDNTICTYTMKIVSEQIDEQINRNL